MVRGINMEYKPLEEMMPKMKDLFENSFRAIEKEQNAGFIVCEDEKKNVAIGGVCKGDCYKGGIAALLDGRDG